MKKRITDLNERYGKILKGSLLLAILFHILGFAVLPGYSPEPGIDPIVITPRDTIWAPPEPSPTDPEPQPPEEPDRGIIKEIFDDERRDDVKPLPDSLDDVKRQLVPPIPAEPVFVGDTDVFPKPLQIIKPEYPSIAKEAGIEGVVVLKLTLDIHGSVIEADVVQSPHETLSRAAIEAAINSKYSPAFLNGVTVRVWIAQTYQFELR
jgi:protein TonB